MLTFGLQRRTKHSATILMRQLISLCFVFSAYQCFGSHLISNKLNGILGGGDYLKSNNDEINDHSVSLLLQCCFGNSIALIQLSECTTYETDILFSIIYGAIMFPVGIAWINDGGWLNIYGF